MSRVVGLLGEKIKLSNGQRYPNNKAKLFVFRCQVIKDIVRYLNSCTVL